MPSESDKWGWEHVSVVGGFEKGSGTKRWKCNHCNLRYNGSYSRVRAHLLGFSGVGIKSCPAIDGSLREAFEVLEEERLAHKKKRNSTIKKPAKRLRISKPAANHSSRTITREDVDDKVARFFYANGLNFSTVNSPYFQEMVKAVGGFGLGYDLPPVDKLSDYFLSKEKVRIERTVALIRESWPHTGCTILCVGRVDDITNNIFVSSPRGLVFLKALGTKNISELDEEFIGSLSDAIKEVGPANVLQIIFHPGYTSKSIELVLSSKFPSIFCSPCTSSSIRILMEDIAELEWMKPVVVLAKEIEKCLLTHQHSFPTLLMQRLKEPNGQLISKFAPSYCIVHRTIELKEVLRELVVGGEWKLRKQNVLNDYAAIESAILGEEFWGKADLFLQIYNHFLTIMSALDVEKSVMGVVYDWRVQSLEELRNQGIVDEKSFGQLDDLIENKWDLLFSPLHAAGYLLNPKYLRRVQTKSKSVGVMRGWKAVIDKYGRDGTERRLLREQVSSYWLLEGSLGEEDAVECRDKMDPVAWWENFGFEFPELQTLAIKVLSQVSSAAICEEIWERCDFCRQETLNRFEDLVYVRNNLRLHGQRSGNSSSLQRHSSLSSRDIALLDQNPATEKLS